MALDLIFPDWPAPPRVQAAITTRSGGCSQGPWQSMNLGDHVGDDSACVAENRFRLKKALSIPEPEWLTQVHGVKVLELGAAEVGGKPEADASWTACPGYVCAIMTADCLPVLFCDESGTRVAAAHAGWRGLAQGVLRQTVSALALPSSSLLAYMGPAIGPTAFEVGAEVQRLFDCNALSEWHKSEIGKCFCSKSEGKWLADIYGLARAELRALGLDRVYGGEFCTLQDGARFYSYRRDGVTGRMASLIWLSP